MDIIQYLLSFIQYQHQQICWLLNFICRYIPLKQWAFDDSHSPKYQKFKVEDVFRKILYVLCVVRLFISSTTIIAVMGSINVKSVGIPSLPVIPQLPLCAFCALTAVILYFPKKTGSGLSWMPQAVPLSDTRSLTTEASAPVSLLCGWLSAILQNCLKTLNSLQMDTVPIH